MKHWQTTIFGIAAILGAICNAITTYMKTGQFDVTATTIEIALGIGLLRAADSNKT